MKRCLSSGKTLAVSLGLVCMLGGCGGAPNAEHDEHGHAEPAHAELDPGEHAEAGEASPHLPLAGVVGIRFERAGEPAREGAWFAAEAIADPSATAALTAPVAGIVVRLAAEPGARVEVGSPLLEIRSPEVAELVAAAQTAAARAALAVTELERERRLLAAGATSAREVEQAEAELRMAEAARESARLGLAARGLPSAGTEASVVLRAPRAGILGRYTVLLGQGVEAGTPLGEIVAPGAELAQVELPLPGPSDWPVGAETQVRQADGRSWTARVEGVPAGLSAETRRLTYRLRLTSGPPPLAGTPLEVRVPLATGIVLPQGALQQIEGSWGVFVRDSEEARFVPVRKGAELGGDVLVLAGVEPGQEVATDGAYLLKALYLKLAGGGGDAHAH